jgi:hypothetical protein
MDQRHWVVCQEGPVAVPRHKINQEVAVYVWSISVSYILTYLSILPDQGMVVPGTFMPSEQAVFIKSQTEWVIRFILHHA